MPETASDIAFSCEKNSPLCTSACIPIASLPVKDYYIYYSIDYAAVWMINEDI
jgi:hypothetical protein